MTPLEVRKAAFEYERKNQHASLSQAFMQGYIYAENNHAPIFVDDTPEIEVNDFDMLWYLYDRKDNKQNAIKAWKKLTATERRKVFDHVESFVRAHPDKKYRPMLATYLNQKRFNDEEIIYNGTEQTTNSQQQRLVNYAEAIANFK